MAETQDTVKKDSVQETGQVPHLNRLQDFETALADYHISPQGIEIMRETPFVTLTAPTASGRNTIINEVVKSGDYHFIISDTTRPPRTNNGVLEQNGVEYFFRSEEDMLQDIRAGMFVEAEVIHGQQVSGVSIREINTARQKGKIAITDIDILGACNVASIKPDAVQFFVLPPSFDEWMDRIHKRGIMQPAELHRRMQTATKMLRIALESSFFSFIINDDLQQAVKTVHLAATKGKHYEDAEHSAYELAIMLYAHTCKYLKENAPDVKWY